MPSDPDFDRQVFEEINRLVAPLSQSYAGKGELGEKFREALRAIELRDRPRTAQLLDAILQEGRKISPKHIPPLDVAKRLLTLSPEEEREPFDHAGYLTELKATQARLEKQKIMTWDTVRYLIGFGLGSLLLPVGLAFREPRVAMVGGICCIGFAFYVYFVVSLRQMKRQGLHMTNTEIALHEDRVGRSEQSCVERL
jgi:hypothetical protein